MFQRLRLTQVFFIPSNISNTLTRDTLKADSSRARQAFTDAENDLKKMQEEKKTAEEDVSDIFTAEGFGLEGEWKKLDGTCLEYDVADYTYEVCLFEEAKQKPKNGGVTHSLGSVILFELLGLHLSYGLTS